MSIIDRLEKKFFPARVARREVDGLLNELKERPREGDPTLHGKLDELNQRTSAFDPQNLAEAYQAGMSKDYQGASLSDVRDAVGQKQKGFAKELAGQVMADGTLSESEKVAIGQMTRQHYTQYGNCGDQPMLHHMESAQLQSFASAPTDQLRNWMLEHANSERIDLPAAQQLGEMIFAGETPDMAVRDHALKMGRVFDAPMSGESKFFLLALDGTDPNLRPRGDKDTGPSLRERAYSADTPEYFHWEEEPVVERPGPCEKALMAGVEFAASRQKGLADSAQARSLFPQK